MVERDRFIFRGQGRSGWPLLTSLDRYVQEHGLGDRIIVEGTLIETFRDGMQAIDPSVAQLEGRRLRTIARHAGLPSSIMDWSQSPYIAVFFAVDSALRLGLSDSFCVWAFDCGVIDDSLSELIDRVDVTTTLSGNPRAIAQQAVALDVIGSDLPLEQLLPGGTLRRFDIPATEATRVLERLEAMRIDAAEMYGTSESVAQHAAWRSRMIHRSEQL